MGREFPLTPRRVPEVNTTHRRIVTPIPVPASIPLLEKLRKHEPASMGGQPAVIWHEGDGFHIRDPYGNQWIDFSAGVLVASMGYGHPRVTAAMRRQLDTGLYHTYCFANEPRIELVEKLASMVPPPLEKVFLLSTGSEAVECAIKLAFTYASRNGQIREDALRHLRERVPRTDLGFPARGWDAGPERVDTEERTPSSCRFPSRTGSGRPTRRSTCSSGASPSTEWRPTRSAAS